MASNQKDENVVNDNTEEERAKYWVLSNTIINLLSRTEFMIDIYALHPFV